MSFTYDLHKSRKNMAKHGIDFVQAQRLWDDPNRQEVPARKIDEERSMVIGRIEDKVWTAIITYRDDVIRIISVRSARKEEIERYEG